MRLVLQNRSFAARSMGLVRADEVDEAHLAICENLRQAEIAPDADHRDALVQYLEIFRRWLR